MNKKPKFIVPGGQWKIGDNHQILDCNNCPVAVVPSHPEWEYAEALIAAAPELLGAVVCAAGMLRGVANVLADSLPETSDYLRDRVADLLDLTDRATGVKP